MFVVSEQILPTITNPNHWCIAKINAPVFIADVILSLRMQIQAAHILYPRQQSNLIGHFFSLGRSEHHPVH
jgi:hypothetical protein